MRLSLVPSYGRDYKSAKEVVADFDAGKDFTISDISSVYDGKYINKPQLPKGSVVNIRYNKLRKVKVIKVS